MNNQGEFNQELALYLHKVVLMIDRTADRALRQNVNISLSQFIILNNIYQSGKNDLSQQNIADYLGIDKAALSRHVANLLNQKLTFRAYNSGSKREYTLSLTEDGEKVLIHAKHIMRKEMTPHFLAAGKMGMKMMLKTLKSIHDSFE